MNERYPSENIRDREAVLIADALHPLNEKNLVQARMVGPDSVVELQYAHGAIQYLAECKFSIDRKSQIDQIRPQQTPTGAARLLVTSHITRELADHCRTIGVQFVDASGNAYLHGPGLLIFITGEKREGTRKSARPPKGLTNPSALRVLLVLLAKPALVNATLKDISDCAGVSLGTVHNTLGDLEQRGYLLDRGNAGLRKLLERERLLDEWAINYPSVLRPKLDIRRFSAPDPDWWRAADLDRLPIVWGGEVAAMKMTGHLKPATQTLYLQPSDLNEVLGSLVKQHRLRPDPAGDVELVERFWRFKADTSSQLAPPLLVYAELNALLDPRAQETARLIKENFIDTTYDQGRSPG